MYPSSILFRRSVLLVFFKTLPAMRVPGPDPMPYWCCYLIIALAIGGLCYLLYRYSINELLKRQAIRNRIARDLHDHVGSTLSSIAIYSKVARIYEQQESREKLKEILGTIEATADETINEMSDIVWAINPLNDQMITIIQKIKAFVQPLCLTKGIQFDFYEDEKVSKLILEMTARKNLFLILKEALNNAIKHSGCKRITLDMRLSRFYLQILITDDGIGFDAGNTGVDEGFMDGGNGLLNINFRAKELGAQLKICSASGEGTKIDLLYNLHRFKR
ncbi:sensor histidine kinase [Mucilaginibacter sp. BJC16-A38]|uniref:sensor histidine kinase n=1 Tax=Mucilaginibacter phenanthrenivorans TaxID=1234842 RepID=UPI0021570D90|nr:sensor histidine kinase [Mucilaginibacter phenanthrenivorans]MCR8557348.1 sensor histidine kinase [Mucilaginibacter phenanthrenivorans]